jgi:hypothetical protein
MDIFNACTSESAGQVQRAFIIFDQLPENTGQMGWCALLIDFYKIKKGQLPYNTGQTGWYANHPPENTGQMGWYAI